MKHFARICIAFVLIMSAFTAGWALTYRTWKDKSQHAISCCPPPGQVAPDIIADESYIEPKINAAEAEKLARERIESMGISLEDYDTFYVTPQAIHTCTCVKSLFWEIIYCPKDWKGPLGNKVECLFGNVDVEKGILEYAGRSTYTGGFLDSKPYVLEYFLSDGKIRKRNRLNLKNDIVAYEYYTLDPKTNHESDRLIWWREKISEDAHVDFIRYADTGKEYRRFIYDRLFYESIENSEEHLWLDIYTLLPITTQ